LLILSVIVSTPAVAEEAWIVSEPVVLTEPADLGNVIVAGGGSLTALGVPEPGLRFTGHLWVIGDGEVLLENSVVKFMSIYHGQYILVGVEDALITVRGCDYQIPNGVQHALVAAGQSQMVVEDTVFGEAQLIAADLASFDARRLNGHFEVIVQHDAQMRLSDIPATQDTGKLWVWVEVPAGGRVVYSPPLPGYVEAWSYPPADASGIGQSVEMNRCQALLWPLLVRQDSHLTLRDIPEQSWVVVGLHLPDSCLISKLANDTTYSHAQLPLPDRTLLLENASIDTWNLYPQQSATVVVQDSLLGEIIAMDSSTVVMEDTTIDGTGGYFGADSSAEVIASGCTFTCTVEAKQAATIRLHSSLLAPYPVDPTGAFTRAGAYDQARLLIDQSPLMTTPALGGQGLIAFTYLSWVPPTPPLATLDIYGTAAIFSQDAGLALQQWQLRVTDELGASQVIGSGTTNAEESLLGTWPEADPGLDHWLRIELSDGWGRRLTGRQLITGSAPPEPILRRPSGRAWLSTPVHKYGDIRPPLHPPCRRLAP
jgi:hypothetical protein